MKIRAHPAAQDRVLSASPTEPLRVSSLRVTPDLRTSSKLADILFEAPTDALSRINFWCSMIALAGVGGIFALWIVMEMV